MRASIGVLVAAFVVAGVAGGSVAGAQDVVGVDDPSGDTVDCNSGDPLDRPAGDILGASLEDGRLVIHMSMAIGQILDPDENFSSAVRVFALVDEQTAIQAWVVENHDGERTETEVDPTTGEPIDSDLDVSEEDGVLSFAVGATVLTDSTAFGIESFNIPQEGEARSCDLLLAPIDELRAAAGDAGSVGDEPADERASSDDEGVEEISDDGSATTLVMGIVVAVLLLAGLFAWLFGPWSWTRRTRSGGGVAPTPDDTGPCDEAYERWQYWQHLCEEERAEQRKGEAWARDQITKLSERLENLGSWETVQREVLEQSIGRYRDLLGEPEGEGVAGLCDQAAESKRAFEECVERHTAREPVGAAVATGGAEGPEVTGSGTAAVTPDATEPEPRPVTRERRCPEGAKRNERWEQQPSVELVIDFEVRLVPEGTRFVATPEEARELGQSLEEIAKTLEELSEGKLPGAAGEVQELRDAFTNFGEHLEEVAEKGVSEYAERQLKAELKAKVGEVNGKLQAAAESASGVPWGEIKDAATKVPEMMRSPGKASLEILRFTADLGATVARFCGRLVQSTNLYTLVVVKKTMQIDVMWHHWEVCVDGSWRRTGKVIAPPGPTKETISRNLTRYPVVGPGHSGYEFMRQLRGLERAAHGEMERSEAELVEALTPPFAGS